MANGKSKQSGGINAAGDLRAGGDAVGGDKTETHIEDSHAVTNVARGGSSEVVVNFPWPPGLPDVQAKLIQQFVDDWKGRIEQQAQQLEMLRARAGELELRNQAVTRELDGQRALTAEGGRQAQALAESLDRQRRSGRALLGGLLALAAGAIALLALIAYFCLRPVPRAQITYPLDYDGTAAVPMNLTAKVDYANIPGDRYLWTVVRVPGVLPMRRIYPQLRNGMPPPVTGTGHFEIGVTFGVPESSGDPFNLEVLLVDRAMNQKLLAFARDCLNPQIHACDGLPFPDYPAAGVEVLDFVTVVRQ